MYSKFPGGKKNHVKKYPSFDKYDEQDHHQHRGHNAPPAHVPSPSHAAGRQSTIPPLTDLHRWFGYFDKDRNGTLDKEETVAAVAQTYGSYGKFTDIASIRESVYAIWSTFDRDGNGSIDRSEFLSRGGLGESLQAMMGVESTISSTSSTYMPSNVQSNIFSPVVGTHQKTTHHQQQQQYQQHHHHHHQTTTHHHQQQQQQQQFQTMRVTVPAGMQPGELIKIQTPSGELKTVPIPELSAWKRTQSGQSTFDVKIPSKSAPSPAVAQSHSPSYPAHNHTPSYQTHSHATSSPHSHASTTEPQPQRFTAWSQFRGVNLHSTNAHTPTLNIRINPSQFIRPSGRRRALLIGINYHGTKAALRGCINDAKNMQTLLLQQGYPNDSEHMLLMTDDRSTPSNRQPTGVNIVKAMQWLLQGVAKGDMLFFHFSGHGSQVPDKTGFEKDGLNETILPIDYKKGQLKDDQLWDNLVYPLPEGVRLTALMDCCHSGTGLDLPYEYRSFSLGNWEEDINTAHSKGDVVLFSGCQDDQTSADVGGGGGFLNQYQAGGAMTQSFIQAFQSNPMATYPQFMASIQQSLTQRRFKQRPQLTSSQRFDANSRIFSLVDGIEPNRNSTIGRVQRKKFKPAKTFGNSPLDQLLGISPTTAVGLLLGAMALDALF